MVVGGGGGGGGGQWNSFSLTASETAASSLYLYWNLERL